MDQFQQVSVISIKDKEELRNHIEPGTEIIVPDDLNSGFFNIQKIVVLEKGTQNGYPIVYLFVDLGKGSVAVAVITGRLWATATGFIKGIANQNGKFDI